MSDAIALALALAEIVDEVGLLGVVEEVAQQQTRVRSVAPRLLDEVVKLLLDQPGPRHLTTLMARLAPRETVHHHLPTCRPLGNAQISVRLQDARSDADQERGQSRLYV